MAIIRMDGKFGNPGGFTKWLSAVALLPRDTESGTSGSGRGSQFPGITRFLWRYLSSAKHGGLGTLRRVFQSAEKGPAETS
jgi:hypothetical protein